MSAVRIQVHMLKAAAVAGIFFGLLFGLLQAIASGPIAGVVSGVVSGTLFGAAMYIFVNLPPIQRQIRVSESELFPGETILLTRLANLIVRPKDFGLKRFACDDLLWLVGMKNKESLGGALHLTNYRIIFRSHKLNRLRGTTSIFLPSVQNAHNASLWIFGKMCVTTTLGKVEFIVFDVNTLVKAIDTARRKLTSEDKAQLSEHVTKRLAAESDGLESWKAINKVNQALLIGKSTGKVIKLVTNPIAALSAIFVNEIVDKTIAEPWQKVFDSRTDEGAENQ